MYLRPYATSPLNCISRRLKMYCGINPAMRLKMYSEEISWEKKPFLSCAFFHVRKSICITICIYIYIICVCIYFLVLVKGLIESDWKTGFQPSSLFAALFLRVTLRRYRLWRTVTARRRKITGAVQVQFYGVSLHVNQYRPGRPSITNAKVKQPHCCL